LMLSCTNRSFFGVWRWQQLLLFCQFKSLVCDFFFFLLSFFHSVFQLFFLLSFSIIIIIILIKIMIYSLQFFFVSQNLQSWEFIEIACWKPILT
jgi:hypothetical protein